MIKLLLLLKRKQGMTPEDFRRYYEERHVPLATSLQPKLAGYRRNYVGLMTVGVTEYDCVTETWYDLEGKWSDHRDSMVTPAIAALIAEDEAHFLDRPSTRVFVVHEAGEPPRS